MRKHKKLLERIIGFFTIVILLIAGIYFFPPKTNTIFQTFHPSPTPTPTPAFTTYHAPIIPKKDYYRIALFGDSMTSILSPHGGALSDQLNTLYQSMPGHQKILIDNYAQGSTNILDIFNQMNKQLVIDNNVLVPPFFKPVDLILIESFGYNPLSTLSRQEGLDKQTQTLETVMTMLTNQHSNTAVMFVATIAPNKETYALEENPGISIADRMVEAEERIAFIQNHIAFAKAHRIPLIDIFSASLLPNGDGNLIYINPGDHIHPSQIGVDFIDSQIAHFIYDSKVLPQ